MKVIIGLKNRVLHLVAHFAPGAMSVRVWLHRLRGVNIGRNVWIGYGRSLSKPHVPISLLSAITRLLAYVRCSLRTFASEKVSEFEEDVFIGPGAIILPGVTVGRGAVVTAGSVVAESVPPATMVQGNPARPVASCGAVLRTKASGSGNFTDR